jgi:hypothetical protein
MKALELLGRLSLNMCIANPMERIAISGTDVYEAIAELEAMNLTRREWYQKGFNEAMKQRTCDGCIYGVFGVDSFGLEIECTLAYRCSRGQDDMFKPKDNK